MGDLGSIPGLGRSLGWEDLLEKGTATHSSILAWRIPWTEEPDRLHCMGLQRAESDTTDRRSLSNQVHSYLFVLRSQGLEHIKFNQRKCSSGETFSLAFNILVVGTLLTRSLPPVLRENSLFSSFFFFFLSSFHSSQLTLT